MGYKNRFRGYYENSACIRSVKNFRSRESVRDNTAPALSASPEGGGGRSAPQTTAPGVSPGSLSPAMEFWGGLGNKMIFPSARKMTLKWFIMPSHLFYRELYPGIHRVGGDDERK